MVGETGVAGPLEPSAEDGGDWGAGEAGADMVKESGFEGRI